MNEQEILGVIYDAYVKHGGDPGIHFIAKHPYGRARPVCPLAARNRKSLGDWQRRYYRIDCELLGYSTQIHRPFAVGREPSALYRKLFDVALEC